jgi:ferric-dicitrate binding protein FerR (iron transport regulator)
MWLAKSTAHRVAYIRLETVWQRMQGLKASVAGVMPPADQS